MYLPCVWQLQLFNQKLHAVCSLQPANTQVLHLLLTNHHSTCNHTMFAIHHTQLYYMKVYHTRQLYELQCEHVSQIELEQHYINLFEFNPQFDYYGIVVAQPICRDGPISRWRLQSMYQHFHSNIVAREQMLASKSTSSSSQSLPPSACSIVIAMCSNYVKVANLKQS